MQQETPPNANVAVAPETHPATPDDVEKGAAEAVRHPAKVMRIAAMARQLLDELRHAPMDEESRSRLRELYETSVTELATILSPDLKDELARLSLPFEEESPSDAELRVAHAQLVGWLEGLFHGIQAMLFAQQMESRQRVEQMRKSLPGATSPSQGTYL